MNIKLPVGFNVTTIRQNDIPVWLPLVDGLNRHLAKSPAFKPYPGPESIDRLGEILRQPGHFAWMVWQKPDLKDAR